MAVDGRYGDRVAEAERIKLIYRRIHAAGGVHLVDRKHRGLFRAQQHIGDVLVRGGDARADVGHQNDNVSGADGDIRLLAHEQEYFVVGRGLDAAGVDDIELSSEPFALGVKPVARDAGGILDDGQPLSAEFIEQHGFSHIRSAYYGNERFGHIGQPPF